MGNKVRLIGDGCCRPVRSDNRLKLETELIESARKRLQGTWRSDKQRTMQNWVFPKRIANERLRLFTSIFGKNTWRFTPQLCFGEFEEMRWRCKYTILWADEWSVVLLLVTSKKEERCHHLFFEDEYFYFSAGRAGNAEYFKKIAG